MFLKERGFGVSEFRAACGLEVHGFRIWGFRVSGVGFRAI